MKAFFTISLGMAVCLSPLGCGQTKEAGHDAHAEKEHGQAPKAVDAHPTQGPHGGHLIELGAEEYHAELLHDEKTQTVTVNILDGAGKEPVAIDDPEIVLQIFREGKFIQFVLKAAPAEKTENGVSQFAIVDETLCDALGHWTAIRGRINLSIKGKKFFGVIEHQAHGHDGHDHGHEKHAGQPKQIGHEHDEREKHDH